MLGGPKRITMKHDYLRNGGPWCGYGADYWRKETQAGMWKGLPLPK